MLLFRSEEGVLRWCEQMGIPRGATLSIEQVWDLSQRWYGDRLDPTFRGRTASEAERIFQQVGLTGSFWSAESAPH